jgi:DNA excision repair protein ERCC-8
VYSHAASDIASHLLVACATTHPAVRLIDLRSGSATHALAGHSGAVMSVAWHPKDENVLASGGTDGGIRVWDVRRSASSLGVLDAEDSIGLAGYDGRGTGARGRERGKAHSGAVNGIVWSDDGQYLVSTGHDERMRVWDMTSGANTLAHFGSGLKNTQRTALYPLLAPRVVGAGGREVVFYPNPKEVLAFDLHAGKLLGRLRATAQQQRGGEDGMGVRNLVPRTTSLAWRAYNVEMYSAHADGVIRCWRPRTSEDRIADEEDKDDDDGLEDSNERKRKREELEQIVRDLTGKRITYS